MQSTDKSDALPQHTLSDVKSNGLTLSVLELGRKSSGNTTIVMHHGLRDSAHALLPTATQLSEHFHILVPELRGHGRSDRGDAYGAFDFVLDLHETIETLAGNRIALFGHSLGGHIVSKYAANFPEKVHALMIVEGLGPPHLARGETKQQKCRCFSL